MKVQPVVEEVSMQVFYFPVLTAIPGSFTARTSILTEPLGDGQQGEGLYVAIRARNFEEAERMAKNPSNGDDWTFVHNPIGNQEYILCGRCRAESASWVLHTLECDHPFCDADARVQHEFGQANDDFFWEYLLGTEDLQAA